MTGAAGQPAGSLDDRIGMIPLHERRRAMPGQQDIRTARLVLRLWRDEDLPAFAAMNADPRVMEYFPTVLSRTESDALASCIRRNWSTLGFAQWAVEVPGIADFIGFAGLSIPNFEARFMPCVEIGWRLAFDHWGHGYAAEAASAAVAYAFGSLELRELVSFTSCGNQRSRNVMKRLGMTHSDEDDFEHPRLPAGHHLRPHVLYHLTRAGWNGSVDRTG